MTPRDAQLEAALRRYLRVRPFSFALWRYGELVPLWPQTLAPPVLDLGCGDGVFASCLQQAPAGHGRWLGADRDPPSLGLARESRAYRLVVRSDIHALPFLGRSFGSVLSNCVLEHVERPADLLAEVRRVLRPGGTLWFTVPSPEFPRLLALARALRRVGLGAAADAYAGAVNRMLDHRHLWAPEHWRATLERAGLTDVQCVPYAAPAVTAAFDAGFALAAPAFALRALLHRWVVLPKGALAAAAIRALVGTGAPATGGGLLVSARRPLDAA